jgi:hypothetical protein
MAKQKKRMLERKKRSDKAEKRKQLLVTYFIVILMVSSVVGFAMVGGQTGTQDTIEYASYAFEINLEQHPLAPGFSINTFVEKKTGALFYTSPYEAEAIPTTGNLTDMLRTKPYVVYAFEPDTEFDQLHDWLRFEFSSKSNKIIIPGVTQESEVYTSLPTITCANATVETPVMIITQGNQTSIEVTQSGCIQIETKPQDILFTRDRILYSFLGIIQK